MKLVLLLIAHFTGDFILQPMSLAVKKKTSFKYQIIHALLYAILLSLVYLLYDNYLQAIILFVITFIIHLIIDYLRIVISKDKNSRFQLISFFVDQFIHIILIFATTFILDSFNKLGNLLNIDFDNAKVVFGFIFVLSPASVSIKHILNLFNDDKNDICIDEDKIGSLIGKLERIIIVILGILGLYTSIALVFTAKSLARFKQLDNKSFAERYLVGTFLSLIFALLAILIIK